MLNSFFILSSYLAQNNLCLLYYSCSVLNTFLGISTYLSKKILWLTHSLTLTQTVLYIKRLTRCYTASIFGRFFILRAVIYFVYLTAAICLCCVSVCVRCSTVLQRECELLAHSFIHSITHSLTQPFAHTNRDISLISALSSCKLLVSSAFTTKIFLCNSRLISSYLRLI
jgi:hypothetical protein